MKPSRLVGVFAAVGGACYVSGQTAPVSDAATRRTERELVGRLRSEILWNDSRTVIRVPANGSASLALCRTADSLSYCSRDLAKCAQYPIEYRRVGPAMRSTACNAEKPPCGGAKDDMQSVLAFIGRGEAGRTGAPEGPGGIDLGSPPGAAAGRTLAGIPASPGFILWTATAAVGQRSEILKDYQKLRPAEVWGLRDWLRTTLAGAGYRSVTIPCFTSSDPTVHLYGDRPKLGPIVFSVLWDDEQEEWRYAGMLEGEEHRAEIDELKGLIQSIACCTVYFE